MVVEGNKIANHEDCEAPSTGLSAEKKGSEATRGREIGKRGHKGKTTVATVSSRHPVCCCADVILMLLTWN